MKRTADTTHFLDARIAHIDARIEVLDAEIKALRQRKREALRLLHGCPVRTERRIRF